MKRRCPLLIAWLILALVVALITLGISTLPTKTCDYCHEPFIEKITQVREYTLCPNCWDRLSYESGKVWGNLEDGYAEEWRYERMQWIYDKVKERNEKD